MRANWMRVGAAVAGWVLLGGVCLGLVVRSPGGAWPEQWSGQLQPYRARATTHDIMTGRQEAAYEIPFDSRKEFEEVWPVLAAMVAKGGTVTVRDVGPAETFHLFRGDRPTVWIQAPVNGMEFLEIDGPVDDAALPWNGWMREIRPERPEYVVRSKDGKLWVAVGDPRAGMGFQFRARVDLVLVVDGSVIDLDRVGMPTDVRVIDQRKPAAASQPGIAR